MNNDSFEFKCPFDEQTNEEIIFFELTTKIVRKKKRRISIEHMIYMPLFTRRPISGRRKYQL